MSDSNMTNLHSIVYVSSAVDEMSVEQMEHLLVEARAVNAANDVSGVMLYNDGNIMQCIEGPAASVHQTFKRICASRRHRDIHQLVSEPIQARSFAGWSMGLTRASHSQLLELSTARWQAAIDDQQRTAADSSGLELLKVFWELARR